MWPRDLELTLALWLLVSPFVFGHGGDAAAWATDLACGAAMVAFALLPRWRPLRRAHLLHARPLRRAHLLHAAPAAWLAAFGWLRAPAPAAQNELVVALLLIMLAIIPSDANAPPRGWRALERGGVA
jgi:hypothetical protein